MLRRPPPSLRFLSSPPSPPRPPQADPRSPLLKAAIAYLIPPFGEPRSYERLVWHRRELAQMLVIPTLLFFFLRSQDRERIEREKNGGFKMLRKRGFEKEEAEGVPEGERRRVSPIEERNARRIEAEEGGGDVAELRELLRRLEGRLGELEGRNPDAVEFGKAAARAEVPEEVRGEAERALGGEVVEVELPTVDAMLGYFLEEARGAADGWVGGVLESVGLGAWRSKGGGKEEEPVDPTPPLKELPGLYAADARRRLLAALGLSED